MNVCGSFSFYNFFPRVDSLVYFPESLLFNGQSCKIVNLRWKIMKSKSFVVKHFYSCCLSCKAGQRDGFWLTSSEDKNKDILDMDFSLLSHPSRARSRTRRACPPQGGGQGLGLVLQGQDQVRGWLELVLLVSRQGGGQGQGWLWIEQRLLLLRKLCAPMPQMPGSHLKKNCNN